MDYLYFVQDFDFDFDLELALAGFGFDFGWISVGFGLISLGFDLISLGYSSNSSHGSLGGPRKLQVKSQKLQVRFVEAPSEILPELQKLQKL